MRHALLLVLLLAGCLESPEEPVLEHPLTQPPETVILEGPEETVHRAAVRFRWQGNHRFVSQFQYRIDQGGWSAWFDSTWVELVLDEGEHTFEVRGRIPPGEGEPGVEEREPAVWGPFAVDAIQGPAVWIRPRRASVHKGEELVLDLMAEEVGDLMLAHLELGFDPDRLVWVEAEPGGFLGRNQAEVIFFGRADPARGTGVLDLGAAGGDPHGVSGSGRLARVRFRGVARGRVEVRFGGGTDLRDTGNRSLELKEREGCEIEVK